MATTRRTPAKRASKATTEPAPDPAVEQLPPDDDQDPPDNVIAALARVQQFIGGIPKLTSAQHRQRIGVSTGDNEQGVKYAFRSIDQITQRAQPLFGRYGVVIVPRIGSFDQQPIEVAGKPWVECTVTVHWTIYGPGGAHDFIEASTIGSGRDNSDKAVNKAMTSAYKNLVLRLLTIGDPDDDPDHSKAETERRGKPEPDPAEIANIAEADQVFERVKAIAGEHGAKLAAFGKEHDGKRFDNVSLRDADWRALVVAELDRIDNDADGDALAGALDADVEAELLEGQGYGD